MTDIEARIQRLEDLEAIRRLKAQYCKYADENSDDAGRSFSELFTEDAILDEGEELGIVKGKKALYNVHRHFWKGLKLNQHLVFSPVIDVVGDRATGKWRLLQLVHSVSGGNEEAFWACGNYDEVYRRTSDGWKFAHVKAGVYFCCPYEDGWAKTPFAEAIPADIIEGLAKAAGNGA